MEPALDENQELVEKPKFFNNSFKLGVMIGIIIGLIFGAVIFIELVVFVF